MTAPLRFFANINTFNACADRYVFSGYGERLTFDHRLIDGGPTARFLQRVIELIGHPYLLLVQNRREIR